MKKILIPTMIVLIGLITLSFTPGKDGVTLRLKPKTGKTYTIQTKSSMLNMMEIQGQNMSSTQVIETRQTFTAKDVNDKEVTVEGQTEAMKVTVSQMGMVLTYDSEHPEKTSPMLAGQTEELAADLNKLYTFTYDALGTPIGDSESQTVQLSAAIMPMPENPVKEGDSWTSSRTQDISGTVINANMTYTVTKISKKSIEIDVKGTVETEKEAEVSGSYEGTASIDPETGLVIKSSLKQNFSLTLSEQGMTLPLTISGTTTVTVE